MILHVTNASVGGGSFDARLSGAGISFGGTAGTGGFGDLNGDDRGRGSREGETINVPESGILHIRMKNGTTQDINLSRVSSITVRP